MTSANLQNSNFTRYTVKGMQKYRKVKIVGKGSFGYAVLVESKKTKKQYIMKIIDISKMDQKQIEEALMQVQLLKIMRYPYVVTYRQSFMEKMCLCIVMDYCEGGDMFHKIAKQKQLGTLFPEHQIVTWLVQMALSMNYVHDKKILHRDLKTQNIFLSSKGDIKIGDFGIARVLQHTYDCANTAIGTPYYLSPQICQEKPYNQKSDIWSLGCIFYQIATLNHAFDAQNMKGLVQKILKGTYPPLPEVYSSDLKKLLSQMLTKDPNKRPSIRKILEMPFMKAKINQLFSSTIKIHQLKLQKENTTNKPESLALQKHRPQQKKIQSKQKSISSMFKKKEDYSRERKHEESSRERKMEVVSKNSSGSSSVLFKKKQEHSQNSSKEGYILPKRMPLRQDDLNTKSTRKDQRSSDKPLKKDSHEKSVFEEEETLEEQGYGLLLRDMKRCIKGDQLQQVVLRESQRLTPKYLNISKVPGICEKDTVGNKIQAVRVYLQNQIGDKFYNIYNLIRDQQDEDYEQAKKMLGRQKIKFIPLVVQLIVCEDNYY